MECVRYVTLGEVLEGADALLPNSFSREEKVRWLSSFDGRIYREIFRVHEGAPPSFTGYEAFGLSRTMLVPEPFGMELYLAYLENIMDHYNGDTARYNNSLDRVSVLVREFSRWYHRTHRPLGDKRKFW